MTNRDDHGSLSRRVLRLLDAFDHGLERTEYWILAFGVLGMAALGITNVIARNVLAESLTFAKEVNEILIIAVTFAGLGFAARAGRHIRMTALYDQFSAGARKTLMVVIGLTTAMLLFLLAYYAARYVASTYRIGSVTPALRIPLYLVYLVAPVGLVLGGVQFVLAALRNVLEPGVHISFRRRDEYDDAHGPGAV
ncbi:MAG: TRAP transporter small permease [Gammaproteobacteria bacterium]